MEAHETIRCEGHPNIRGHHPTTFEVTTESNLTLKGDCIIGVKAEKGAPALDPVFRQVLRTEGAVLFTRLTDGHTTVMVRSQGSPRLTLTHPTDLVWRKSGYIDDRTIGLWSDHVAASLPRSLISRLQKGERLIVEMTAVTPG